MQKSEGQRHRNICSRNGGVAWGIFMMSDNFPDLMDNLFCLFSMWLVVLHTFGLNDKMSIKYV